jgi:hypothetical protein
MVEVDGIMWVYSVNPIHNKFMPYAYMIDRDHDWVVYEKIEYKVCNPEDCGDCIG